MKYRIIKKRYCGSYTEIFPQRKRWWGWETMPFAVPHNYSNYASTLDAARETIKLDIENRQSLSLK